MWKSNGGPPNFPLLLGFEASGPPASVLLRWQTRELSGSLSGRQCLVQSKVTGLSENPTSVGLGASGSSSDAGNRRFYLARLAPFSSALKPSSSPVLSRALNPPSLIPRFTEQPRSSQTCGAAAARGGVGGIALCSLVPKLPLFRSDAMKGRPRDGAN